MLINEYLSRQAPEWKNLLSSIHQIIINTDKAVIPDVGKMMSKEMILYKEGGVMKYGLAAVKKYMSLHLMPIYGSPALHDKYVKKLTKAKFQKGCINFSSEEEMPLDIVQELINDCAKVDLKVMLEKFKRK